MICSTTEIFDTELNHELEKVFVEKIIIQNG